MNYLLCRMAVMGRENSIHSLTHSLTCALLTWNRIGLTCTLCTYGYICYANAKLNFCVYSKTAELASLLRNILQMQAVTTHFKSTRHVTRFTKRKFVGLQQSTDVCLTTPLWPSLMTSLANIFPSLCWRTMRGLAWWTHGGPGQVSFSWGLITLNYHS